MTSDKCIHDCNNKTPEGFCKTTACTNRLYNGSGTYIVPKEYFYKKCIEKDKDYGVGRFA